ncbi:hypothetical protein N7527_010348 [Penicillium freii]|nr:hypothetical protein N7527_010348 [Penicillium freii]
MLHIWYFTWTRTRRSSQIGRKYYPVHTRPTVRSRCRNVLLQGSCTLTNIGSAGMVAPLAVPGTWSPTFVQANRVLLNEWRHSRGPRRDLPPN